MKKEVLILFKTHLDVGFTDLAATVKEKYLTKYIPSAIKVGYELKDTATPFIWTVGSWMIWEALKHDTDGTVEKAVRDGIITWHALPFTTHTELMSVKLFEYGLQISEKLDKRFGKKTIGAKMTDVPGHTLGMIPLMCRHGVKFMHIGVNGATPVPPVPPLFRWKLGEDFITVMYQGEYGLDADFGDFAVCFAHTNDNCGPQSAEEIVKVYGEIAKRCPDCTLRAATLDDVAERVAALPDVPVLEKEIGDTWIHGAGTDPKKISKYRALLRHIEENGIDADVTDSLLCIPEHTWGLDVKTFFPNNAVYTHTELDTVKDQRAFIESSWAEQRAYLDLAEKTLNCHLESDPVPPSLDGYTETVAPVIDDFEISWQLFDVSDYERYKKDYMRTHIWWAIGDFTKVDLPSYKGGIYTAKPVAAYEKDGKTLVRLEFDKEITEYLGLPYFILERKKSGIELKWFGKKASRLPQACWLKFKGQTEKWEISKMGVWIKPENVIGSPFITATDRGVRNGSVRIEPLDSTLVAPYGRRLLRYGEETGNEDLYFNLYNNIWNTNFPMWYSDDAIFRFNVNDYSERKEK